jgi:hypothetical protein
MPEDAPVIKAVGRLVIVLYPEMVWEDQGEGVRSGSLLSIQEKSGLGDEQFWVLNCEPWPESGYRMSCALGNMHCNVKELMLGTMMSLWPLTIKWAGLSFR